jgi:hypothetical protein
MHAKPESTGCIGQAAKKAAARWYCPARELGMEGCEPLLSERPASPPTPTRASHDQARQHLDDAGLAALVGTAVAAATGVEGGGQAWQPSPPENHDSTTARGPFATKAF